MKKSTTNNKYEQQNIKGFLSNTISMFVLANECQEFSTENFKLFNRNPSLDCR